jgi:hypothetical protein
MESEGMKEDSPVNTQQNACTEQISSQTEWSASGMSAIESVSVNHLPEEIKAAYWNCSHTGCNVTFKTAGLHTSRREGKGTRPSRLVELDIWKAKNALC